METSIIVIWLQKDKKQNKKESYKKNNVVIWLREDTKQNKKDSYKKNYIVIQILIIKIYIIDYFIHNLISLF